MRQKWMLTVLCKARGYIARQHQRQTLPLGAPEVIGTAEGQRQKKEK
jgi:hypothetical protein